MGERRRLRVASFEPRRIDWWASVVQLAGTLFFNVSTFEALQEGLSTAQENRLIWAPDVFGCACFLIASALAWGEACGGVFCRPRRQAEWWVAALNLVGSVAFAIAGVASYFVPDTGRHPRPRRGELDDRDRRAVLPGRRRGAAGRGEACAHPGRARASAWVMHRRGPLPGPRRDGTFVM